MKMTEEKCNKKCKECYNLTCSKRKEFPDKKIVTNEYIEEHLSKQLLNE